MMTDFLEKRATILRAAARALDRLGDGDTAMALNALSTVPAVEVSRLRRDPMPPGRIDLD